MNLKSFSQRLETQLSLSLQRQTIAGHPQPNEAELAVIQHQLSSMGFQWERFEGSPHHQPALIARRAATQAGTGKLCMYNHYDVEPIHKSSWRFPPFALSRSGNRIYGRGVADNKAVLWTRLLSLQQRWEAEKADPAILWLIQGEEEVGPTISYDPFRQAMQKFQADIHLEETGYHTADGQQFLTITGSPDFENWLARFAARAGISPYFIQHRHLNKSYAQQPCPFLTGIPEGGTYLSFGPNDPDCRIHSDNESLDWQMLLDYKTQFVAFLDEMSQGEPG